EVVREMNRLGIMVDVSHISKAAALHAARISTAPIIASHSSARALTGIERNMDDEMMRALAATGGVMQVVAFAGYVKETPAERQQAMQALRQELGMTGGRGGMQSADSATRAKYQAG